jgi:hypothetical protein
VAPPRAPIAQRFAVVLSNDSSAPPRRRLNVGSADGRQWWVGDRLRRPTHSPPLAPSSRERLTMHGPFVGA